MATAGHDQGFENGAYARPQGQVGVTDDTSANMNRPLMAADFCRGNTVSEFSLADRGEGRIARRAVAHPCALHIDGGADVVPGAHIRDQIVEQVARRRAVVKMVVGIDDRQIGFESRFDT